MKRTFPLLLSLVFWFAPACKDDPVPAAQACTPGKSEACVGVGGCAGGQVCDPSGAGFGACVCAPGADTGADSDMVDSTMPVDSTSPADSAMESGDSASGDAGPCDIVAQTGCASGEKCTNVEGVNKCAPNGTVAVGGTCMTSTTSDDCVRGAVCLGGACLKACDGAVPTSCPTNYTCVNYSSGMGSVGGCTSKCDPVTQVRLSDGAAACGSTDPTNPNKGCFGAPDKEFTCAPAPFDRKHGEDASGGGGPIYLNSCAPGYLALMRESSVMTSKIICVALCRPSPTSTTATANAGGLAPNTCAARGATGAECHYFGFFEDSSLPKTWAATNVGFCVTPANYTYDHDMNPGTAEIVWPSCTTIASTDAKSLKFGCTPRP